MSMQIIKAGISDTIQDAGRHGFSKWGVNPGGWMDEFAAVAANALVGNPSNHPVLEIHFPASTIKFETPCLLTICGADFSPHINNIPIPCWKPVYVPGGSILTFTAHRWGARAYMAVHGTIAADRWLGSVSTNLKVGRGGIQGRPLRKGDLIDILPGSYQRETDELLTLPWSVKFQNIYNDTRSLRFTDGHELRQLTAASRLLLKSGTMQCTMDSASDRMACQLRHEKVNFDQQTSLLSSAVCKGTIQGLPNGGLLILMADHQTTGGYPRIGHVIRADHPKLAQLKANETFLLMPCSIEESQTAMLSLLKDIQQIERSCKRKLQDYAKEH